MTTRDRIRAILRDNVGPMRGRDIADALGAEGDKARAPIFSTLTMMADEELGIERTDDGKYQLVPGWVKGTGAANRARRHATTLGNRKPQVDVSVEAVLALPTTPIAPKAKKKAKREPFRQPITKAGIEIRGNDAPPAIEPSATAQLSLEALQVANDSPLALSTLGVQLETVLVPRRSLRLVVAALFAHGDKLDDATRAAMRDVSAAAV